MAVDRVEYSKGDSNLKNLRRTKDEENPIA